QPNGYAVRNSAKASRYTSTEGSKSRIKDIVEGWFGVRDAAIIRKQNR
ncbi:hypothetical protein HMPREF3208_01349, partial [Gardnerella vaginalis]